ncbi:DUF4179 domain-containing protein [Bhargavaea massiliensis]|uniref:DUF4179 domain-containing protein n=1 Tax=Bhargavaea massiliensis TaxID=2697500 RepID=UPI001BCCA1DA|nr:DUF4179 domain-containing protein [Bhargavaea massiliensis]
MTEREEERLRHMKERLDDLPVPEEALSAAIQAGMQKGVRDRSRRKRQVRKMLWSVAAVAVLLVVFITSVRVSPVFAKAVSSLPGMSVIVKLIQFDKGMQAIIDNEYYEEIHVTGSDGAVTITLTGVIVDQSGMVVMYTIDSTTGLKDPAIGITELYTDGKLIEPQGIVFGNPADDGKLSNEQYINFNFADPLPPDTREFELKLSIRDTENHVFQLPFTIQKPIAEGELYDLNRVVTFEGQKVVIESVTVHPLKVAVRIKEDPDNTMDILQYEDLRIENSKGEIWSKTTNGMSGTWDEDGTKILFLQSSFFEQPDRMIFRMNRMQAIDKKEKLVVDTLSGEVIEVPSDGKLEVRKLTPTLVETKMKTGPRFGYGYLKEAVDAEGKVIDLSSSGYHEEGDYSYSDLSFKSGDYKNPITIHFFAYPNYIEGDVTVHLE